MTLNFGSVSILLERNDHDARRWQDLLGAQLMKSERADELDELT